MATAHKVAAKVVEPPYELVLTLTQEEAEFLRATVGKAQAEGPSYEIFKALGHAGVENTPAGQAAFKKTFRYLYSTYRD